MSGTAVDNIIQRLRKHREEEQGQGEALARFLVTKTSWRGNYRRILIITSSSVVTQHPDSLAITNAWAFSGDHDIAGVEIGGESPEGGTFTLQFRKDKKNIKNRDAKFVCKERAALLTVLYDAIAAASAKGLSGAATTLLTRPETYQAFKLLKGEWVPVALRVTTTALERLDPGTGTVKWRWGYATAASPAVRLLRSGDAPQGLPVFVVFSKTGRSPRVYAARNRDALLRAVQAVALGSLGVTLAIDASVVETLTGRELLTMVSAAERERAATAAEAPLGEWEVLKVHEQHDMPAASLALPMLPSTDPSLSIRGGGITPGVKAVTSRRLVLTAVGLLERRPATYEVAEWRQFPAVAALIRYADDPQWLGIEWSDGSTRSIYVTPARESLLAGLLYTAQAAAGRPVPVLPGPTGSGDTISAVKGQPSGAPAIALIDEVERMMLYQITSAANEFMVAGGTDLSLNALALAGLTAATAAAAGPMAASIGPGGAVAVPSSPSGGSGLGGTRSVAALEYRVREFNASVPYSGVHPGCRVEENVVAALVSYLPKQQAAGSQPTLGPEEARLVIMALHCLQRLSSSPHIAMQITGGAGGAGRIFSALLSRHDHVATEAARLLLRLFSPAAGRTGAPPRPADGAPGGSPMAAPGAMEDVASSRACKSICFISDARCGSLLSPLKQSQESRGPSPLLAGAIMEVVAAVACKPGSRTTELATKEALLHEVAAMGRPLFALFNHPARQIGDAAALAMQAIAEGGAGAAAPMREAALAEGAVLHHLLRSMGPTTSRQQLSRHLVALWSDAHDPTLRLLRRIFPPGLMRFLDEPKKKAGTTPVRRLGPPDRRSLLATVPGTGAGAGATPVGGSTSASGHIIAPSSMSPRLTTTSSMSDGETGGAIFTPGTLSGRGGGPLQGGGAPIPSRLSSQGGSVPVASAEEGRETAASVVAPSETASAIRETPGVDLSGPTTTAGGGGGGRGGVVHMPGGAGYNNSLAGSGQRNLVGAGQGPLGPSSGVVDQLQTQSQALQSQVPHQLPLPPAQIAERLLAGGRRPTGAPELKGNWEAFWAAVDKDHCHAALIWNERTRAELREALQAEENILRLGRQRVADSGGASPSWNAAEFSVEYPSLASQLTIGGVHVKLLLEAANAATAAEAAADLRSLINPKEFFTALHLHFLRRGDVGMGVSPSAGAQSSQSTRAATWSGVDAAAERELCVRAMAATYAVHAAEIGPFEGMQHIVDLLDSTPSRPMRQRLLTLVEALICPEDLTGDGSTSGTTDGITRTTSSGMSIEDTAASLTPRDQFGRPRSASDNDGIGVGSDNNHGSVSLRYSGGYSASTATQQRQRLLFQQKVAEAAQTNATALVAAGGIELLVDLMATAHEASERPAAALQTGLIASTPHAEAVKLWYYLPKDAGNLPAGGAAGAALAFFEERKKGPVSKAEIRQLYNKGIITSGTPFWAPGMAEPAPLAAVRELRWWVATGTGHLAPFKVAEVVLRVLTAIVKLRPAVDAKGEALIPLPAAHRLLASARCLPHVAQVTLTGEPSLVVAASSLLLLLVEHDYEAMSGLYRTGVFFFLLSYCGSNLLEVAKLFKVAHLRQRFLGAGDAAPGLPLSKRSILGSLLPESLLYSLESYGPEAFASALAGDADTPEVIWTHRMRGQRLVPQMLRHIGDLPRRLAECGATVYDYTPCPPVGYPEIAEEVWCHRYYLRHLCDESKFPDWPLVDHVPFLQALLEAWRAELTRRPLGLSAADAAKVLELDVNAPEGLNEETMKAAYRRLARKYHPDRNPEGRDRFEAVQRAYEVLQAGGTGGGPQPWRILLLLRAQCILFRRCASVLQHYKYAGYPLLLAAIEAPPNVEGSPHFLSDEIAPRLQAATELCWLTCAASKLNGEELARSGGVHLMGDLLTRCISVMPEDVSPTAPAAVLATQALRAFACMAAFATARADIEKRDQVVEDVLRACALQRAPSATDAALQCAIQMCRSSGLQEALLRRGALGYFIPLLLRFDPTAVDSTSKGAAAPAAATSTSTTQGRKLVNGSTTRNNNNGGGGGGGKDSGLPEIFDPQEESVRGPEFLGLGVTWTNMQAARNHHAALAVRALAALGGYNECRPATPECRKAQEAIAGLLTWALAPRLVDQNPRSLLTDLNSSVASPHVIWNSRMREELTAAAEEQRRRPGADSLVAAAQFSYAALRGELLVAGVYVRTYNEQPNFPLKDTVAFCKGLVTKIHVLQRQDDSDGAATKSGSGISSQEVDAYGEEVDNQPEESPEQMRRRHLLECLTALSRLLDAHPRLMGVLATKPALEPLLECITPVGELGHSGPLWPKFKLPGAHLPTTAGTAAGEEEQREDRILPRERWTRVKAFSQGTREDQAGVQGLLAGCEAASAALGILLKLTAHAGCVDAMASEKCVVQAYWVAHRPPRPEDQMKALKLLHALSATPAAAWAAAAHGGVFFLAEVLIPVGLESDEGDRAAQESAKIGSAAVLARLAAHPLHGPRVLLWLGKLLPPGLVAAIQDGPAEAAVAALVRPSETPERLWTTAMQRAVAEEVAHLSSTARTAQESTAKLEWSPGESYAMQYEGLRNELFVGGVYVRLFLKNPGHPLRNPQAFLEGVLDKYSSTITIDSSTMSSPESQAVDIDTAVLLSAAAVALIHHHPLLAEHGVALGYVGKLVRALSTRVPAVPVLPTAAVVHSPTTSSTKGGTTGTGDQSPKKKEISPAVSPRAVPQLLADDISGSALRLLHALAAASSGGEALARCTPPAVPVLVGALQWGGTAAVLAVETLKRGLSTTNRSRDLLVGSALNSGLLTLLLNRLDWRSRSGQASPTGHDAAAAAAGDEASDEAVQRVLFVDVINLMALEGQYANQVRSVLDASEVWAAYRGQRHDLFLPSGGTATHGVVGLLKGPEKARFALPAPEVASDSGGVIVPPPPAAAAEEEAARIEVEEPAGAVMAGAVEEVVSKSEADVPSGGGRNDDDIGEESSAAPASAPAAGSLAEQEQVSSSRATDAAVGKSIEEESSFTFGGDPLLSFFESNIPADSSAVTQPLDHPVISHNSAPAPEAAAPVHVAQEMPPPRENPKEAAPMSPPKSPPPAAVAPSSSSAAREELNPTKAFFDPLSALGGGDDSNTY